MSPLPAVKSLESAGFRIEHTDRWIIAIFPDAWDGVLLDVDDDSPGALAHLPMLAADRHRAIAAITTLLADAGWGMKSDLGGQVLLGLRSASSSIHLGWPLSFWLRHESWTAAVRRFVNGFAGVPDDASIERAATIDARARSGDLYRLHLDTCEEIDRNAVDWVIDPVEEARMRAAIDAYRQDSDSEHARRVRAWIVSPEVSAQVAQEIDRARSEILVAGRGLWIGADPLWADVDDDWVTVPEWIEWAAAFPEDAWICSGIGQVLMRFAPSEHRDRIRDCLLRDQRIGVLEHDLSDARLAAHFLDVPELADWVVGVQPFDFAAGPFEALPRQSMFDSYLRLRACLELRATKSASQTLLDLDALLGQPSFVLLTTVETRGILKETARLALEEAVDRQRASVIALSLCRLALAIRDPELADILLTHPAWRDALLYRLGSLGFLTLKESILALSLVLPGSACAALIEDAFEHLDVAYEPHQIDTTALALAVAWRRCRTAAARADGQAGSEEC